MISVVIPAYNEQEAIGSVIGEIRTVLESMNLASWEILVVDDGSADATAAIASKAGAKVIRHPHNIGYGKSVKDGICAAKYDIIAITDADGTYPIGELPRLFAKYQSGFDMVVGERTGEHYRESWFKAPLRWVFKKLVEFTTGRSIPDINSGLRIFSKWDAMLYLNRLCDTFSFTTTLTLAYMMTGKFVTYLPIDYHARVGTTKVRLLRDALRSLQYIVQAIVYYNPIKIFLVMTGLCLLFSVACFAASAILGLNSAFFLGVGTVLVAILVFALGLLADLLRQIMDVGDRRLPSSEQSPKSVSRRSHEPLNVSLGEGERTELPATCE